MIFWCDLKVWSAIEEWLNVSKILRNISSRNSKSKAVIIDIQMLIEKDCQYGLCFWREISDLHTSHSSTWGRWESPKNSSLTLRYRVFVLFLCLFSLINLCFNGSGCPISHGKLACYLINRCVTRLWEEEHSLKRDIFNVNIMLDHLKTAHWVNNISDNFNLFEWDGIVWASHNQVLCILLHLSANL
jgi:hypothetical protein